MFPDAEFEHREIDLGPGPCTVFCYTDGVTEAMNSDRQLYGADRMVESLAHSRQADPSQLIQQLRKSVSAFCGPAPQSDDITVLAVHLK
ncbi:MAG: serine/threonine-protein phosphatase [Planctomycetes bacterium]|nr:serine/threonine-protein phosphatase [Planctomycetota bacterium]